MASQDLKVFISRSHSSTATNKTGSWRFMRPVYSEKTAPCGAACPAGTDIPLLHMLAAKGDYGAAGRQLLTENPFPAVCGFVCYHPCETACHRARFDQAVATNRVERFIGQHLIETAARVEYPLIGQSTPRVAIVGAGPAGLAAAYFLRRFGFECHVYEAGTEPGGLLRWAIPAYRLPVAVLRAEMNRMLQTGISIHCGHRVSNASRAHLTEEFDAVFIGAGHTHARCLPIPGGETATEGLAWLKRQRMGDTGPGSGRAAVIGGGNSAIDVARSLVRSGLDVQIIYRRRKRDMPAFKEEIRQAVEEGIVIRELLAPSKIVSLKNGYDLTLQPMTAVDRNTQGGRARVTPQTGDTQTLRVDHVFAAIGAEAEPLWQPPSQTAGASVPLSHCTLTRDHQKPVVYGGDLTNQKRSVVDAVASGKQAAMALETYFSSGWDAVAERLAACQNAHDPSISMAVYTKGPRQAPQGRPVAFEHLNLDYFEPSKRIEPSKVAPVGGDPQFDGAEARDEARRCFSCGRCNDCDNCRLYCPEIAVQMTPSGRRINLDYCKGCGICVTECPRDAMTLVAEIS